jgi:pSer/pThr/pTyr-binding forkhead associated (FHA) protein
MESPEYPGLPSEPDPPQGGDTGIPTGTVETSDSDESDNNEDGSDERLMLCYGSIEIIITDLGIAIGRDHDNELVIDDAYVSREHAEAIFENGSSILRDSQSANGTSVNGQKITGPTVLNAGDVILIGSDITIYVKAASTSNDDRPEWKLTALSGPDDGAEFNVSGEITTIGRSPSNDIVLNSKKVSREHCHLVFKSGQPCIEDLGSTNGTFVNDIRVRMQILEDGDSIQLGDTKLRISMA